MVSTELLRATFDAGLTYDAYLKTGSPDQLRNWERMHDRVKLAPEQVELLAGFSRNMPVLVISGMWCGDCVQQCPFFDHFAKAAPSVHLRFVDRDAHRELSDRVRICGGNRVPTVIFMNEDFEFVALAGDKSLARLRHAAATQLGPSCPMPGAEVPADEVAASVKDWLSDFERVHLLLRMSAKLRQRHND